MEFKRELLGEWIEPTTEEILLKKDKDFLVREIMFQNDRATKIEQENKKLCEIKLLLVTIYDYLNIENEGANKTEQEICFKIKEILDKE
jgi:hypothetical protein